MVGGVAGAGGEAAGVNGAAVLDPATLSTGTRAVEYVDACCPPDDTAPVTLPRVAQTALTKALPSLIEPYLEGLGAPAQKVVTDFLTGAAREVLEDLERQDGRVLPKTQADIGATLKEVTPQLEAIATLYWSTKKAYPIPELVYFASTKDVLQRVLHQTAAVLCVPGDFPGLAKSDRGPDKTNDVFSAVEGLAHTANILKAKARAEVALGIVPTGNLLPRGPLERLSAVTNGLGVDFSGPVVVFVHHNEVSGFLVGDQIKSLESIQGGMLGAVNAGR